MATDPKPPPARWRITVIRKKGETLGVVEARTAEEAIEKAAEVWDITDPERRRRLTAIRVT